MGPTPGAGVTGGRNQADVEPVPIDRIPPLVLRRSSATSTCSSAWRASATTQLGRRRAPRPLRRLLAWLQLRRPLGQRRDPQGRSGTAGPPAQNRPPCSFTDKFLVVRGDLRTYKIHLGSGNILMEPNDQYLCIVPKRGTAESRADGVFLPFEGDNSLSIILSKALMLAEDRKISDPTITSQIERA